MSDSWEADAANLRATRPRHMLFVGVANAARSQMAEGIARALAPVGVEIASAGSAPSTVSPLAIKVMSKIGLDISTHAPKRLADVAVADFDLVVTLGSGQVCPPLLAHTTLLDWGLPDPEAAPGDEAARLTAFRRVRCELSRRLARVFSPGFLAEPTRYLFFTGKGGVGKTSLSAATAVSLADQGERVLLVSTDAASNLDEILGVELCSSPVPVPGVTGLSVLNVDPDAAAEGYRLRVLAQLGDGVTNEARATVREQLSGACTTEIAAFDEFASLLADAPAEYDHVVFDTAPTGHTLRLLSLPKAWTSFLEGNDRGAFAGAGVPYEADDAEADAVWAAVDARLDAKSAASRAAKEEEEAKATAAGNISGQVRGME